MRFSRSILFVFCLLLIPVVGFCQLQPTLEWSWTGSSELPGYDEVDVTPLVVSLTDDNSDGFFDHNDYPDVVFSSYGGWFGAALRAVDGRDGSPIFDVTNSDYRLESGSNLAAGDIDLDGKVEIIGHKRSTSRLIAFENDGAYKWDSDNFAVDCEWGGPAIADMDQDGIPEIVMGRTVFNSEGSLKWEGDYGGGKNGRWGPLSCLANVDMSGGLELIAGNSVYHSDGSVYWQKASSSGPNFVGPETEDGFPAVADFDADPYPEIVLVARGDLYIFEHDGTLKVGPVAIQGASHSDPTYPGGPPVVYDYDSDGQAEIGVASQTYYTVFEADGSILWSRRINESSSGVSSSTVFDLFGDGAPELLYCDQDSIRILNASNGNILWAREHSTHTAMEFPVVADIDKDGFAEVLTVSSPYAGRTYHGVFAWGFQAQMNPPAEARRIWNQHTYHITNINDDGSVPTVESPNWATLNNFRCQMAGLLGINEAEKPMEKAKSLSLSLMPNPFSARTKVVISSSLEDTGILEQVRVFDCTGRKVRSFDRPSDGTVFWNFIWDGTDDHGRPLPTGVYIISAHLRNARVDAKAIIVR